jgi:cobaltochelatase CobT
VSHTLATVRQQQRTDDLCSAVVRALGAEPDAHVRDRRLYRGAARVPLGAPHLSPSPKHDDFGSLRGVADGLALRIRHSDPDLHRDMAPRDAVERLVFGMLEQFRVEALAPSSMAGVVRNLRHRHVQWSLALHHAGVTETSRGGLLYTVAQVCRSRVTGEPVVPETEHLLEATRGAIAPALGHHVAALRRHRHDQETYAEHALGIARAVAHLVQDTEQKEEDDADEDIDARVGFLLLEDGDDDSGGRPGEPSDDGAAVADTGDGYRVFTSRYDQQCSVSGLVRATLLREYRERLDQQIADRRLNLPRLARRLQELLSDRGHDGWDGGQEEGHVDGRMLGQLIASPNERRIFRTQHPTPQPDCLVTFLVDCSGSMKEHSEPLALLVDVFARALELAGVGSEILGFTTGSWNGGRPRRDWLRAGRPRHPGRLNELRHLVLKDADTPYRRARPGIAGLLKTDLYREGVDGEAVAWACERMQGRPERRRILMVLSDGGPMDAATNLSNATGCLDRHLEDVVLRYEHRGTVEIHGLGVGLDLSRYYRSSHVLDLSTGASNAVLGEIVDLLARRRPPL